MTSIANKTKVQVDYERVIKIVESVESKDHLDVSLRCFFLLSLKHKERNLTSSEKLIVSNFKSKFWAIYKNKEQLFLPLSRS